MTAVIGILVLSPPGAQASTGQGVRYAFIPYVPEQGAGCGANSVNANNAYGNGYLDGYGIVAGHEYAEAVTDPDNQMGTQDG